MRLTLLGTDGKDSVLLKAPTPLKPNKHAAATQSEPVN